MNDICKEIIYNGNPITAKQIIDSLKPISINLNCIHYELSNAVNRAFLIGEGIKIYHRSTSELWNKQLNRLISTNRRIKITVHGIPYICDVMRFLPFIQEAHGREFIIEIDSIFVLFTQPLIYELKSYIATIMRFPRDIDTSLEIQNMEWWGTISITCSHIQSYLLRDYNIMFFSTEKSLVEHKKIDTTVSINSVFFNMECNVYLDMFEIVEWGESHSITIDNYLREMGAFRPLIFKPFWKKKVVN